MLIWIKAPCVAIGIVIIFVLLLSATVCQEIPATTEGYNSTIVVSTETGEFVTLPMMELPFIGSLIDPCAAIGHRPTTINLPGRRSTFEVQFFHFLRTQASYYKENIERLLPDSLLNNCPELQVANLPDTPTVQELKNMDIEAALNKIYSSLLTHTAYAYYIHHEFNSSAIGCSQDTQSKKNFVDEVLDLATKEKTLACGIQVGIVALGYRLGETPALHIMMEELSLCSRRALRDCQVIKSTLNFFEMVSTYSEEFV